MDQIRMNQATMWKAQAEHAAAVVASRKPKKYKMVPSPLTPPQRAMAEQFLPLARALARPLKQMFPHWKDDFESAACLALVEAARSFDPERNIRFATFARFRIRGALFDVGRSMSLAGWEGDHENAPDLVRLTPLNEEFGIVLNSVRDPEVGADVDAIDAVEQWLRKLPRRHAEVCRRYYIDGKTQAEVAGEMGVSQSEITRIHRQSLDLLSEPYRSGDAACPGWRRRNRRAADAPMNRPAIAV
jgi:RNA polymerase sigma factor (sigma-70 family)